MVPEYYDLIISFVERYLPNEIVPKIDRHYVEDEILHCVVDESIVASYPVRNIRKYYRT